MTENTNKSKINTHICSMPFHRAISYHVTRVQIDRLRAFFGGEI